MGFSTGTKLLVTKRNMRSGSGALSTWGTNLPFFLTVKSISRLRMSVTTQGGSGRQYVTGPGRNISKYRFVLLNVYRFREI